MFPGYLWKMFDFYYARSLPDPRGLPVPVTENSGALGRSPGGGHSNPVQYSCLENPHGQKSLVGYSLWDTKESDTTEAT